MLATFGKWRQSTSSSNMLRIVFYCEIANQCASKLHSTACLQVTAKDIAGARKLVAKLAGKDAPIKVLERCTTAWLTLSSLMHCMLTGWLDFGSRWRRRSSRGARSELARRTRLWKSLGAACLLSSFVLSSAHSLARQIMSAWGLRRLCPISLQAMRRPVLPSSGQAYDEINIVRRRSHLLNLHLVHLTVPCSSV